MQAITYKQITIEDPLYQQERELRNKVLLRPAGIPDFGWEMFDKQSAHFVAVMNGKVVGCALLNMFEESNESARLMQMAVNEELHGHGIGAKLVSTLLDFARNRKLTKVTCHAQSQVTGFYSKAGFEEYGEPFEEAGIIHRHMKIDLKTAI